MPGASHDTSLDTVVDLISSQARRLQDARDCALAVEHALLAGKGFPLAKAAWARAAWLREQGGHVVTPAHARQLAHMVSDLPQVRAWWAQALLRACYADAVVRSASEFLAPSPYAVALVAASRSSGSDAALWLAVADELDEPGWPDVAVFVQQAGDAQHLQEAARAGRHHGFLRAAQRWQAFLAGNFQLAWDGTPLERELLGTASLRGVRRRTVRALAAYHRASGWRLQGLPAALTWPPAGGAPPLGLVAVALELVSAAAAARGTRELADDDALAMDGRSLVARASDPGFGAWLERLVAPAPAQASVMAATLEQREQP